MRSFYTLLFCSLFSFATLAQKAPSAKKIEASADEYFRIDDFANALRLYHKLDSLQPNVGKTNYRIGYCIFNTEQKTKALPYFQKAKLAGYEGKDLDLYLARSLHLNHRFDEAIAAYKSYTPGTVDKKNKEQNDEDQKTAGELEMEAIKENVNRYIAMCETGKQLVSDSLKLVIENMGPIVNSKYPDYVPVVSEDETTLIFTSRRPNTTGGKKDPLDNQYFEDVYISTKDSATGQWTEPRDLGTQVNSPEHDASVGLSPDGKKLFIYRAEFSRKQSGDIYLSTLREDGWSKPKRMESPINTAYWEPSASLTNDEKTIFVSSNRPGGFGGTDIYVIKMKDDSTWGDAVNLGPKVNTEFDEDAPYIHPDKKTLFFSSRGHNTMGGYDIFTTTLTQLNDSTEEWAAPVNAGYPINTADDDIYFVWSADGSRGYFSSWRDDSYGEKDLYMIRKAHQVLLIGNISDAETHLSLKATVTVKDMDKNELIGVFNTDSTGHYELKLPNGTNYSITAESENHLFQSTSVHVDAKIGSQEIRKDISLQPVKEGLAIVLNNIFFDFDKATLRSESDAELENLYAFLIKYPELKVELSGHTDGFGSDRYNQRLSDKRAKAVVAYLIQKGISKKRLVAKGYGESKPLESNDTDEGRQLNRRTELKIIDDNFNVITNYKNTAIKYKNEFTGEITASGRTAGGKQQFETLPKENALESVPSQDTRTSFYSGVEYRRGTKYYLPLAMPKADALLKPKVHFVSHVTSKLTLYSTQRVMEMVEILKAYPSTKLKLVAYADLSGTSYLTKEIAESRLATVMQLLTQQGIEPARLSAEVKALENAGNDPEADIHNRRVEFITTE
jgi:outer membrane protein OmpA-like peptidoglycan-associated protein/tetratricopeptide (TPR) repeat protein